MQKIEVSAGQPNWAGEQKHWLSWVPSRSLISDPVKYRNAPLDFVIVKL